MNIPLNFLRRAIASPHKVVEDDDKASLGLLLPDDVIRAAAAKRESDGAGGGGGGGGDGANAIEARMKELVAVLGQHGLEARKRMIELEKVRSVFLWMRSRASRGDCLSLPPLDLNRC